MRRVVATLLAAKNPRTGSQLAQSGTRDISVDLGAPPGVERPKNSL